MLLLLSVYHVAVGELLIHILYVHFTVIIFLDFLQRNWTLHVPPCLCLVLFPAPLFLPVFRFVCVLPSPPSFPIHAATFLSTSTNSLFKIVLSWLLISMSLFHDGYDIWTMKWVIWQTPRFLIKHPHYLVKGSVQLISKWPSTLTFGKLLECIFFSLLEFLVLCNRFCIYSIIL